MNFVPAFTDQSRKWLEVNEVARIWNRSPRMIRRWCADGTLAAMDAKVYRDIRGRWWIGVNWSDVPELSVPIV
jgi:hypothetical protein